MPLSKAPIQYQLRRCRCKAERDPQPVCLLTLVGYKLLLLRRQMKRECLMGLNSGNAACYLFRLLADWFKNTLQRWTWVWEGWMFLSLGCAGANEYLWVLWRHLSMLIVTFLSEDKSQMFISDLLFILVSWKGFTVLDHIWLFPYLHLTFHFHLTSSNMAFPVHTTNSPSKCYTVEQKVESCVCL